MMSCGGLLVAVPDAAARSPDIDWQAYLYGPRHDSYNQAATAITPSNAASMTQAWNWMPPAPPNPALGYLLLSSPTVFNGQIFIGANNGTFYALNESTGAVIWSDFIGYTTSTTCAPNDFGNAGFASTAAVADSPTTGDPTVYVNAPNGYLYALDAATGAVIWKAVVGIPSPTQNDYFAWSSPTVANGHVYVGITSQCDDPLIQGGVLSFDQASGVEDAAYYNVPSGDVGGSVWSSVAVNFFGNVYETSGNGPPVQQRLGTSESIVELNGTTLKKISSWQIPKQAVGVDSDFGGSPTLFSAVLPGSSTATPMVGACNKNGVYYALRANDLAAGPVWQLTVGARPHDNVECIAAAVYDGQHLFVAAGATTIGGTSYNGSIDEVDPATGSVLWATGLPAGVDGSPTLDGAGILAVATFALRGPTNGLYLVNAATGAILNTLGPGGAASAEFPQPSFDGDDVFGATDGTGLTAYSPKG